MTNFISNEAKRFAAIIYHGVGNFEILNSLQERFEKELVSFKENETKKSFLISLELEVKSLFESHLEGCKKIETCPQHKTYRNISFLISEEMKLLSNETLTSLIPNNEDYTRYLENYQKKIQTTSIYLEKEDFIKQEINRITTLFLEKKVITQFHNAKVIASFDFGKYSKLAYEWLIAGHDLALVQIINNAKRDYLQSHSSIWSEKEFTDAIIKNLSSGVAYVLYEKFLKDQIKNSSNEKISPVMTTNFHIGDNFGQLNQTGHSSTNNLKSRINEKPSSKKNWLVTLFSNPWVVTIASGLLIAFLAKYFGWV